MDQENRTAHRAAAIIADQRTNGVSRRAVLNGLGLGSLGLLAGDLFGRDNAAAATPAAAELKSKPVHASKTKWPRDSDGNPVQPGPFLVQASCELSEDYFRTDEVLIDDDDKILPFSHSDGTVEALVLTGGQLAYLSHDVAASTGWSYTALDLTAMGIGTPHAAAVASGVGTNPILMVLGAPPQPGLPAPVRFFTLTANGWQQVGSSGLVANNAIPNTTLRAGIANDLSAFFYAVCNSGGDNNTAEVILWNLQTPQGVIVSKGSTGGDQVADAAIVLNLAQGTTTTGALAVIVNSTIDVATQTSRSSFSGIGGSSISDAAALIGMYPSASTDHVSLLYQDTSGAVWNSTGGAKQSIGTAGALNDPAHIAVWHLDQRYTAAFIDEATVNLTTQYEAPAPISGLWFTDPIPLAPGLSRIYSVPSDTSKSTLFAVDLDGGLSVLTRTAATSVTAPAWSQHIVHQDGASTQEIACWRTQLRVQDVNGAGVSAGALRVTADRPAALWQDNTAATMFSPGIPIVFKSDGTGELTFSSPTAELDTAILTVQALDWSGNPSGDPLTVYPNHDVLNFLTGEGSLRGIGPLNGAALIGAQNTIWNTTSQSYVTSGPLLPGLSQLSGSTQTASAQAVAGAITHLASLTTAVPAVSSDIRSGFFDCSTNTPTFTTSVDPHNFDGKLNGGSSWWNTASHDLKSFLHGMRHGCYGLHGVQTWWDDGGKRWVVNVLIDAGHEIKQLATYVIGEAETLFPALGALISWLGAKLEHFWNWLKHLVLGTIRQAEAGAKVMQGWLAQLTEELTDTLTAAETATDGWFAKQTNTVNGYITEAETKLEKKIFGTTAPLPPPTTNSSGDGSGLDFTKIEDAAEYLTYLSPMYWLNKLKKYLPKSLDDSSGPQFTIDLTAVLSDLETAIDDAGHIATDAFTIFWTDMQDALSQKTTLLAQDLSTFFAEFTKLVDDVLQFMDAVADTVFELLKAVIAGIEAFITYEFQAIPVIGDLLELVGVDTTTSISHLLTLVVAYPTALINELAYNSDDMFPPQQDDSSHRRRGRVAGSQHYDPWGVALNWPSAVAQTIWTINDTYIDVQNYTDKANPDIWRDNFSASPLMTAIDIVCPVLLNTLQWPGASLSNGKTAWPFHGGVNKETKDWGLAIGAIVAAFIPPILGLATVIGSAAKVKMPKFNGVISPMLTSISGEANAVLNATWTGENRAWLGLAESILGNLSYIDSFLSMQPFSDDPYALLAKVVIDTVGNGGTAVCFVAGAIQANIPQ